MNLQPFTAAKVDDTRDILHLAVAGTPLVYSREFCLIGSLEYCSYARSTLAYVSDTSVGTRDSLALN